MQTFERQKAGDATGEGIEVPLTSEEATFAPLFTRNFTSGILEFQPSERKFCICDTFSGSEYDTSPKGPLSNN